MMPLISYDDALAMLSKESPNELPREKRRKRPKPEGPLCLSSLGAREREVLGAVLAGQENREIADTLGLAMQTVSNYKLMTLRKLDLRNTVDLVRLAIRNGLIEA